MTPAFLNTTTTSTTARPVTTTTAKPRPPSTTATTAQTLSNSNTYTNSDGNTVQSPAEMVMAGAPDNPPQSKALPISLPAAGAYGNIPGGDQTHPKEVWYRTGSVSGPATLRFQVYNVQQGEVSLYVNWRLMGTINPTNTNSWGVSRSVAIPASVVHSSGRNVVGFVARGTRAHWSVWGVRRVSIG